MSIPSPDDKVLKQLPNTLTGCIDVRQVSEELHKQLFDLLQQVNKVKEDIMREFNDSQFCKSLDVCSAEVFSYGYGAALSAGKVSKIMWSPSDPYRILWRIQLMDEAGKPLSVPIQREYAPAPPQTIYSTDPKTTNLLLSGKLLSEDEKRQFLSGIPLHEIMGEKEKALNS